MFAAIGFCVATVDGRSVAAPPVCIEPQNNTGSSQAVVVDATHLVHTAQIFPQMTAANITEQVQQVLHRLDEILQAADSSLAQIVKLNVYVRSPEVTAVVEQQLAALYPGEYKPAVSFVTTVLPFASADIGLDAVAMSTKANLKQVERLPATGSDKFSSAAILPVGSRIYVSGQAEAGDGTLADATRKTMASLFATLKWLELSPSDIVELKAFLTPMGDSASAVQEIVNSFGTTLPPPLSIVEWQSTLPIEIELIAAAKSDDAKPVCEYLTPPGMTASPVFARVTRVHATKIIYFSGLYGSSNEPSGETEVRELFATTERIALAAGSDLHHLVKATYYVTDNEVSAWHNRLRPIFYDPQRPPAASKAMVAGVGRPHRSITWDLIAVPKTR